MSDLCRRVKTSRVLSRSCYTLGVAPGCEERRWGTYSGNDTQSTIKTGNHCHAHAVVELSRSAPWHVGAGFEASSGTPEAPDRRRIESSRERTRDRREQSRPEVARARHRSREYTRSDSRHSRMTRTQNSSQNRPSRSRNPTRPRRPAIFRRPRIPPMRIRCRRMLSSKTMSIESSRPPPAAVPKSRANRLPRCRPVAAVAVKTGAARGTKRPGASGSCARVRRLAADGDADARNPNRS